MCSPGSRRDTCCTRPATSLSRSGRLERREPRWSAQSRPPPRLRGPRYGARRPGSAFGNASECRRASGSSGLRDPLRRRARLSYARGAARLSRRGVSLSARRRRHPLRLKQLVPGPRMAFVMAARPSTQGGNGPAQEPESRAVGSLPIRRVDSHAAGDRGQVQEGWGLSSWIVVAASSRDQDPTRLRRNTRMFRSVRVS